MSNSELQSIPAPFHSEGTSTSQEWQNPAERKVTLDEMQEMAGNGTLETFLNLVGILKMPVAVTKAVKRRMGEGPSFDRETFDQAAYDKRLLEGNK